jgi:hypothetical protein
MWPMGLLFKAVMNVNECFHNEDHNYANGLHIDAVHLEYSMSIFTSMAYRDY